MSCCQCQGIESVFDAKVAREELENYRKQGPAKTTRMLLEALYTAGVDGLTLLDIGGGVGSIQHELAPRTDAPIVNVDASSAYSRTAREEAQRRGYAERARYLHGDFVELAEEVDPAGIVTLDRVLCCYPDVEALVKLSAARAGRFYGLIYPRDTWWIRLFHPLANLLMRLQRMSFRIFIHPTKLVDELVRGYGFRPIFTGRTLLWQVILYEMRQ